MCRKTGAILLCLIIVVCFAPAALAADIQTPVVTTSADTFPFSILTDFIDGMDSVDGTTSTVEIMILLTILTLVPSILVLMTSFTRIIIVLSFTRNAMGAQQSPPNQVMTGLALFLTFMIMFPVFTEINEKALIPYSREEINISQALDGTIKPMRVFMFEQIRIQKHESDLVNFMNLSGHSMPDSLEDIPTHVLIPAFITSEIKTAFRIGFYLFIPFIVIDMVVASALMSMGMMMLPPAMISLPFKIMLFVMIDGWNLVVASLVRTFQP